MAGRTIGKLAKAAGVNVETVRFYEREGLLKRPLKTGTGWRQYDDQALHTLRFIKRAQALGFSLREVRQLLALRTNRMDRCGDVRRSAEEKVADIDSRIADLRAIRSALADLIDRCHSRPDQLSCPIVESLSESVRSTDVVRKTG